MGPIWLARGAPKNFKNRVEKRAEALSEMGAKGVGQERPGQAGCGGTVIVISPPDVSLTGRAYDHAGLVFICDQASHAGRRRD